MRVAVVKFDLAVVRQTEKKKNRFFLRNKNVSSPKLHVYANV